MHGLPDCTAAISTAQSASEMARILKAAEPLR